MKYIAYMIYGGTIVTPLSTWHDTKAQAMDEAAAQTKPENHQFIGVVNNAPESALAEAVLNNIHRQHKMYGDRFAK